jgi:signal transduction histidine kinase
MAGRVMNDVATRPAATMPVAPMAAPHTSPRRRLAVRLAWLTVAAVLLAEAAFVVPSLVRRRQEWLDLRMHEAQLAAISATLAPNGMVDRATRDELLRLAGAEAIYLEQPGHETIVLAHDSGLPAADMVDLRKESPLAAAADAFAGLFGQDDRLLAVVSASPLRQDITVTTIVHAERLHDALVSHMRRFGTISLSVAAAAGLLLYLALLFLLVRPLRRLTASIAAFRADPERCAPLDVTTLPRWRRDEVTAAARELAAMQRELRAALWRNARLAALGTAVAKVNHDLRGILSPAMLTAERLQDHADPAVRRAGDLLIRAVERAAELTRRTLDFAREAPLTLPRQRLRPRETVEDAAEQVHAICPDLTVANRIPADIAIEADPESMLRVFANLIRNAGEAGATRVSVTAAVEGGEFAITVADDGPGLPEPVRTALFRPFVEGGRRGGTGLGLAIVHDLMRAHGGDATLLDSGPTGTSFRLTLPDRLVIAGARTETLAK